MCLLNQAPARRLDQQRDSLFTQAQVKASFATLFQGDGENSLLYVSTAGLGYEAYTIEGS